MPADQPTNPDLQQESPPPEQRPLIERFQNYKKLRQRLVLDLTDNLPEFMDRGYSLEFRQEQALNAASILASRSIRFLPRDAEISQENLSDALLSAQNELAQTEDWFDTVLPSRGKKEKLAQAIASEIDTAEGEKIDFRAAVGEQDRYLTEALQQLPDQEKIINTLKQQLQQDGIPQEQSETIATNAILNYEHNAVRYGASPPRSQLQTFIQRELRRANKMVREEEYGTLSRQAESKTHEEATLRAEAIGGNREEIAKDPSLLRRTFKYTRKLDRFKRVDGTLKKAGAVGKVLHPIRTVKKAVARRVGAAGVKLAIKILQKVGLGTLVRWAEEAAISAGTGGLAIPLMILQEIALTGLGRGIQTVKKSAKELKEAVQAGMRNSLEGSVKIINWGIDNTGAAAGGTVGAGVGAVAGVLLGALIGSVIPIVGTAVGGVIGGFIGGYAGAGYGAKFGYEFRRKLIRKIKRKFILSLAIRRIINDLFGNPLKFLQNLGRAAIQTLGKNVASFISRTASGLKDFFSGAKEFITGGKGPLAQAARGIGRIFGRIPSSIARAFNTVSGWIGGTTSAVATTTEAVSSQVLTSSPGTGLSATTLVSVGLVGTLAIITYAVLIPVFFVPPTEVDPYYEDPSKFIRIVKTACVGGSCGITALPNPETVGYEIIYQIQISSEATDQTINIIGVTDEYTTYGENNPPTPSDIVWTSVPALGPGESWSPPTAPRVIIAAGDTRWFDSLLTNTVTVTFTVGADPTTYESSESLTITIGEPPFCPPSLSPFGSDPYYISGYRWDPARHPGVDLAASVGMPWNVRSTHNCAATVAYVESGQHNCFGAYVVLQSGPYYSFHAHLTGTSVSEGDILGPGHVVGQINGTTGCSSGPHDHYELRMDPGVSPASDWQPWLALNPCEYGINC